MKSIKIIFSLTVLVFVAAVQGCKKDLAELASFSELGTANKEYTVSADAGELKIDVLSNGTFEAAIGQDADWLSIDNPQQKGDASVLVRYQANAGFPRKAPVTLHLTEYGRYDTVYVKQQGTQQPTLAFPVLNTTVLGDGGQVEVTLNTNIPFEDINIQVIYPEVDQEAWVNDDFAYNAADSKFSFTVKPNTSQTDLRSVQIKLQYVDGWGDTNVSTLYLLQANAQNMFGTQAEFTDIRLWAGEKITSDLFIEGYIISDAKNPNAGEAIQTTPTAINYTQNDRTTYIQSLDGRYGFRILTSTANDNIFQRYSKVQILLKGTSISKETNPDFYTINGITSMMVMSQEQGTAAQLPVKQKYMSELTDDDIYTYVTLKDAEFPIRKGSFTPVNEGYTPLFNANRIAKYPLLMRDIQGSNMYLLTNMNTTYRRDGSMLPYGSGKISGVVVHETFTRFEYEDAASEDQYGNIGRYQLRHLAKADIQFNQDFSNGFSALLTEFQYPNISNGKALATYGNGEISSSVSTVNLGRTSDNSYLGLCGANNLGNTNQYGNGVLIGTTKQNQETGTNSDGKGAVTNAAMSANTVWWNDGKQRGEAFVLNVSTQGISTSQLSLQFTILNLVGGTGKGAPRYWKAEWSEHGDMEGTWNTIGKFTVPDAPLWANTTIHQLAGFKNINMSLPLSMLGKPSIYLRLIVDKNLCSDGNTYASEPISVATSTGIGYLAIRYNK